MARVVLSELADEDMSTILADLARDAGSRTARKYIAHFDRLYDLIAQRPDLHAPRPRLGRFIRVGIVLPYLVVYRHILGDNVVSVIRVVHGRRRLTRKLLFQRD